tara:strand:- start:296 stop:433 length:138 start_codon:yes stop_codon:yes gene_type:complete
MRNSKLKKINRLKENARLKEHGRTPAQIARKKRKKVAKLISYASP